MPDLHGTYITLSGRVGEESDFRQERVSWFSIYGGSIMKNQGSRQKDSLLSRRPDLGSHDPSLAPISSKALNWNPLIITPPMPDFKEALSAMVNTSIYRDRAVSGLGPACG